MILDQSIDEKLLSKYAYALSLVDAATKNTEDNQAFWKGLELNFIQRYLEETDADFAFKIPLDILENYFLTIRYLNGTNQSQFPSNLQSPFLPLLKRNFLRYHDFQTPQEVTMYTSMIFSLSQSKTLRYISDEQVKSRIYTFFLQNKDLFGKKEFRQWASSIYKFKLYHKTDLHKSLEQGVVEKLLDVYDQMEVIDIVPICRNIFRGPEFQTPVLFTKL